MFGVDPELLRNASKEFHSGSDAVKDAAELISMLQLDTGALGEVDGAAEFADALAKFTGEHSNDLRKGSAWFVDAAEGLAENADSYQRVDDDSGTSLTNILKALGGGQ